MLPGGAVFAKRRQEERERAEESLVTPTYHSPGTPEPASPPPHHHHNPDTPVSRPVWRPSRGRGRLLTDEPEFIFKFGYDIWIKYVTGYDDELSCYIMLHL